MPPRIQRPLFPGIRPRINPTALVEELLAAPRILETPRRVAYTLPDGRVRTGTVIEEHPPGPWPDPRQRRLDFEGPPPPPVGQLQEVAEKVRLQQAKDLAAQARIAQIEAGPEAAEAMATPLPKLLRAQERKDRFRDPAILGSEIDPAADDPLRWITAQERRLADVEGQAGALPLPPRVKDLRLSQLATVTEPETPSERAAVRQQLGTIPALADKVASQVRRRNPTANATRQADIIQRETGKMVEEVFPKLYYKPYEPAPTDAEIRAKAYLPDELHPDWDEKLQAFARRGTPGELQQLRNELGTAMQERSYDELPVELPRILDNALSLTAGGGQQQAEQIRRLGRPPQAAAQPVTPPEIIARSDVYNPSVLRRGARQFRAEPTGVRWEDRLAPGVTLLSPPRRARKGEPARLKLRTADGAELVLTPEEALQQGLLTSGLEAPTTRAVEEVRRDEPSAFGADLSLIEKITSPGGEPPPPARVQVGDRIPTPGGDLEVVAVNTGPRTKAARSRVGRLQPERKEGQILKGESFFGQPLQEEVVRPRQIERIEQREGRQPTPIYGKAGTVPGVEGGVGWAPALITVKLPNGKLKVFSETAFEQIRGGWAGDRPSALPKSQLPGVEILGGPSFRPGKGWSLQIRQGGREKTLLLSQAVKQGIISPDDARLTGKWREEGGTPGAPPTRPDSGIPPGMPTKSAPTAPSARWARTAPNGYEVSSAGDKRFSALNARLKDGRTIEEAYQLDVKGYRAKGSDWRIGKGKPPLSPMSREELWTRYKALWQQWAQENPERIEELRQKSAGRPLTDKFASTEISQARALAEILGEAPGPPAGPPSGTAPARTPQDPFKGLKAVFLSGAETNRGAKGATGLVHVDDQNIIRDTPPVWKSFRGQTLDKLEKWVNGKGATLGGGAVGGAAIASALGGEEDDAPSDVREALAGIEVAQSGPPRIPLPGKLAGWVGKQNAPLERIPPFLQWPIKTLQKQLTSRDALLEHALSTAAKQKVTSILRGGMGLADEQIQMLVQANRRAERGPQDLTPQVDALLNLIGADRELRTLGGKVSTAEARAADLMRSGDDRAASKALADVSDIQAKLARKEAVPEGLDRAGVAEERALLEGSLDPEQLERVRATSQTFIDQVRHSLDLARREGILSQEEYDEYVKRGGDYVNMGRLASQFDPERGTRVQVEPFSGDPDAWTPATRARLGLSEDPVIEEARGSALTNINPRVAQIRVMEGLTAAVQRNRATKAALTDLLARVDEHGFAIRKSSPDEKLGLDSGLSKVAYLEDGKPVWFAVDKSIAGQLKAWDPKDAPALTGIMGTFKQVFQAMAATVNPAFAAIQLPMDTIATIGMPSWYRHKSGGLAKDLATTFAPVALKTYALELAARMPRLQEASPKVAGAVDAYFADRARRIFQATGAKGAPLGTTLGATERIMGPQYRHGWLPNPVMAGAERYLGLLGKGQDLMLEPLEIAIKRGGFETLRKRGFSPYEAAYETRTYVGTPDFNRKGLLGEQGKNWFMFLNPAIQGIVRVAHKLKEDPAQMAKFAGGIVTALIGAAAYNDQFRDASGQPYVLKEPRDKRRQNVLIAIPGSEHQTSEGDMRMNFLTIPISREGTALVGPIVSLTQMTEGDPDYGATQAILDNLGNWLPGGTTLDQRAPGMTALRRGGAMLNPLIKYPAERFADRNFFTGGPIVGSRVQGLTPREQFTRKTDPTAVAIGQGLNVSPDRLQHLWQTFFPGVGEMLMSGGQLLNPRPGVRTDVEPPEERAVRAPFVGPLVRRFFSSGTQTAQPRMNATNRFYTARDKVDAIAETVRRRPDSQEANNPRMQEIAALAPAFNEISTQLATIQRQKDLLILDESIPLSPDQRRAQLKALWDAEDALLQQGGELAELLKRPPS